MVIECDIKATKKTTIESNSVIMGIYTWCACVSDSVIFFQMICEHKPVSTIEIWIYYGEKKDIACIKLTQNRKKNDSSQSENIYKKKLKPEKKFF